jgi:hypothetical protein
MGRKRTRAETLTCACRPWFRNDDVSWDTNMERFRDFCRAFWTHGFTQVHGVTLRGRTAAVFHNGRDATEYEGEENLSLLANDRIRALSAGLKTEDRPELVSFLNEHGDEVALHGLFHTDHSKMSADEQRRDIGEGLELLGRLFPHKTVRYFIAPFNRTNEATHAVCGEFGLAVLGTQGVLLEADLAGVKFKPGTWYRYHHHRFYPESAFRNYRLSLPALDAALDRNSGPQPAGPRLNAGGKSPGTPLAWGSKLLGLFSGGMKSG